MNTQRPRNTIRIDVSADVHTRLLKYGHSFKQRINTLLSSEEVIQKVVSKPLGKRKSIRMSKEAHATLVEMHRTLGCMSISNVIETMLDTSPVVPPFAPPMDDEETLTTDQAVETRIRVKLEDRNRLRVLSDQAGIPMWVMFREILRSYDEAE